MKEKTFERPASVGILARMRGIGAAEEAGLSKNMLLLLDLAAAALGFLFASCHLVFGAYPLGIALLSVLPHRVWFALIGALLGSLVIGEGGVVYALVCLITVFLRVLISGAERHRGGGLFSENIIRRAALGGLSGLILAVYELLISGFNGGTVAYSLSMILLPVALVPAISGVFDVGYSPSLLIFGTAGGEAKHSRERYDRILFCISALLILFFISRSLDRYALFGVDISLIFSAVLTLFAARRFGGAVGLAVGFISSVGISPLYSVSFALLGLAAGAVFSLGAAVGVSAGLIALSAFGIYAGGVTGILSVLPEALIGSLIIYPACRRVKGTVKHEHAASVERDAADMVGTMALSYRCGLHLGRDELEVALGALAELTRSRFGEVSSHAGEDMAEISRLMKLATAASQSAQGMDETVAERLEDAFYKSGFREGMIRAFGEREKYILCAAEDKDGLLITSKSFMDALKEACGASLATPSFYRRGDMALMETHTVPKYKIEYASASCLGEGDTVSGDSFRVYSSKGGMHYALISDGMGSGEAAQAISGYVADFFDIMKDTELAPSELVYLLNSMLRRGAEECGATVDIFAYDGIWGTASFLKAGAACSYIKRGGALFRIKSDSMPIGVMKKIDAERIGAEIKSGDVIIMMSDGITSAFPDAPWLIEYLSSAQSNMQAFADGIVTLAREHTAGQRDDMTVLVLKISEV